jgi:hypothetical protein
MKYYKYDDGKVWDAKHLLEIKIKKESVEKQRMTRIVLCTLRSGP